jgi:glycosyltransferase involved in cell wall biosynthesis
MVHNLTTWAIALTHRMYGKALVMDGYFYRPDTIPRLNWMRAWARRWLHRYADAYIAYGERGRAELLAEGKAPDRVFVSQNTLDTEHLTAIAREITNERVASLRRRIGLTSEPVLLYAGRLVPEKRVDVAIEALGLLDPPTNLIIVGDGFLRPQLEAMARAMPVHFRGSVDDEELAAYFRLAELLILPGRVGLNCVHGFANGVPCITTSEAVVEQSPEYEYLVHDYNSLILSSDDPALYARTIEALLRDQDRLRRLRAGAIATADRLHMRTMVAEYEKAVLKAAGVS